MDNQYYDSFFGEDVAISIYPSYETKNKSNWLLYTCNSISSLGYIANAVIIYIFCSTLFIISYLGAIISFLLGIASFFWWASQRDNVQRIDIGLYSSLIFWPGCIKICYNNPEIEFTIANIYFVLTLALIYICYDIGVDKFYITLINIVGLIYSIGLVITLNFVEIEYIFKYAIFFILLGFFLKLCDTYKILNATRYGSGTAWFHVLTSLGLLFAWYGFQSLPIKNNIVI